MADSRVAILERLRQAERVGRLPASSSGVAIPQPPSMSAEELLARFVGELAALGVEPHVAESADDVRRHAASIVGTATALCWDAAALPYDVGSVLTNAISGSAPRTEQARAGIGVTGCDAAIAETGSLVLLAGAGRPRAASLLPPVHLAIVRRADLRLSMGEYFAERAAAIAAASSCMIVTGPSRTADIELTLTVGVHGPGKVIVVVGP